MVTYFFENIIRYKSNKVFSIKKTKTKQISLFHTQNNGYGHLYQRPYFFFYHPVYVCMVLCIVPSRHIIAITLTLIQTVTAYVQAQ